MPEKLDSAETSEPFVSFFGEPLFLYASIFFLPVHFFVGFPALFGLKGEIWRFLYDDASNPVAYVILFGVYAPFISVVVSRLYTLAHAAEPAPRGVGQTVFVLSLLASIAPALLLLDCRPQLAKAAKQDRLAAQFERAVFDGDAATALKIAEEAAPVGDDMSRRLDYRLRGIAFELNGEYEKSLDVYRARRDSPSLEARALYRANRAAEAFDAYCYFADLTLLRVGEARVKLENKEKSRYSVPGVVCEAPTAEETLEQERKILFEAAKRRVLFFNGGNRRSPLEPFADYAEFLRFIEAEFAKTDDPLEYKNAVQFWRDVENVPLTDALDKPRRVEDDYTFLSDVSLVL